jgi:DNA-binding transcriptional LysR family regulator
MNWRKLEYFVAVAEEGSISLAAQRLHMTQPPLSQAIMSLERDLDTPLLRRHPKGIELTSAGTLLLEQGRRLLRWSDRVGEEVRRIGSGEAGHLRIASVPTFAWSHLAPLLLELGREAEGLTTELTDPGPAVVLDSVMGGEADVGFVATSNPEGLALSYPQLRVQPLAPIPLALAVQSGAAPGVSMETLMGKTWIVPAAIPGFPGLIEIAEELWRHSGHSPSSIQHVSTLQTALPLVAAGLGVGLLPADFIAAANGRIEALPVGERIPPLHGTLVHSAQVAPSPALKRLLQVTSRHFNAAH